MTVVARTLAVARFLVADVARSQRFLLPFVAHGAVLAVLFGGDPGPPPGPWAVSALAVYPAAAWLAVVVANTEAPEQRAVTIASAGGPSRVAAATLLVALAGGLVLAALSVVLPAVVSRYPYPPPVLVAGTLAHVACAATGTAVGLLVARPVVTRIGWSFCVGIAVVMATAVQPWLPPVGSAVDALLSGRLPVAEAALGAGLAVAAAVVSWAREIRTA
ncbi:hypothetical protein FHX44_112626 [Pseudonocardia hierapolitana]|uniref:ABC-2 type transport system permease protein n=1 Tax=Pseudonocardia hierapolitana TaxID=1128676 RepID=A0A561SPE3_9PSEU|nr:hypothetical protein [Pseudonocardia hierapolitana]TWF76731.1 hypothetical protein FHX44_112626 [Pseudonocardia hierapolitana]